MTQIHRIQKQRQRRKYRVSNRVKSDSTRHRLCVTRSLKNIYAQIIDDANQVTVVSAGSMESVVRETSAYGGNAAAATTVGKLLAERAIEAGIKQVAFDRREYKYHGRVAALADAARDNGLDLGAKKEVVEPVKEKKSGKDKSKSKKK